MSERTCDKCGETKPRKAFWGVNRNIMPTCTACRQKEARRKRYLRAKKKEQAEAAKREAKAAMAKSKKKIEKSNVGPAVAEIKRRISETEFRIKQYAEKISYGAGTKRTETALSDQHQRLEYLEEIKQLLLDDAALGIDRPLEYYLSNTYLLNKHGYPCVVVDADPREDRHGAHN